LQFDRVENIFPEIRVFDDQVDESQAGGDTELHAKLAATYGDVLKETYTKLENSEKPIDILVLVPHSNSQEYRAFVAAIEKLQFPYIDYVVDENRRDIAGTSMVRLCTFHSARGLEGHRVIILGFQSIKKDPDTEVALNLGYITLSRSLFETTILFRKYCRNWGNVEYLFAVIGTANACKKE
jgi:hypothetical protein